MSDEQWSKILEKINKEQPPYGSLTIKLIYHDKRLVKYEITKSETTVLKEEDKPFLGEL